MPTPAVPDVLARLLVSTRNKPEATAVVVGESALTYREFDAASAALAARLRAAGVCRGQTVLLYLRQSVHTVVGMAAALRLGAAWCVVEPGHPVERIETLLHDVDCAALVLDDTQSPQVPDSARIHDAARALADAAPRPLAVLEVGGSQGYGPAPGAEPAPAVDEPGDLPAYIITTSGSTGEPKGIVVSRDNLAHMVAARRDEPGRPTFSTCRFTWDGSLLLLFQALCTGGTAVLADHRAIPDASACAGLVLRWRVAQLVSPPSFYRLMLPHLAGADAHLREVILAGEAFPEALIPQHRAVLPDTRLRNEYGPTETTVTVLAHPVSGPYGGKVPIGTPLGTTAAHVLDERLRPAPAGQLGELYVGGAQVAQGYTARPGGTAQYFVADPFSAGPGARMYRTGDLVRVNEAGEIEFHGRADGQLKVRGVRVERQAVEAVLESHPAVRQATVLGVPDEHGDTGLVAFWSPAGTAVALPDTRELIELCAAHLHDQAVPETFVTVGAMPLAATGKTDEAALLALLPDAPGRPSGGAGSGWTPLQSVVARLWTRVLKHDRFGLRDSFFSVGGNSRRVVELHLGLQREWPGAVRVGQLFDLDTVEAQAAALVAAQSRVRAGGNDGRPGERQ
ncbi:non-ribosomal peptide synthetase [Streptomyces sp. NL15-2K]|uniref:non-ribosomal peptide synthetase n=1 Tax=Streptomyces sp. NL15-2K TaxID=376149 RepID=UPI000F574328|nr:MULTISPECIES: non-ribosomal peptide synthetase [Actinomycetes]WKX14152.1 non-ribosomal peptide synthetase [Kutzneria buriramensis]